MKAPKKQLPTETVKHEEGSGQGLTVKDPNRQAFAERVAFLVDREKNTSRFARKVGVSEGVVRKWRNGESDPSREHVVAIADAYGLSLDWLAAGRGPMFASEKRPEPAAPAGIWEEFALVPLYDIAVSTGPGVCVESETVLAQLAFRRDWLRQTGIQAANLAVVRAVGDSMEPTIRHGDALLIDRAKREPESDHVYVLQVDHELRAKRLQRLTDGRVRVGTDNPAYTEEIIERDRLSQLEIVGRVVWKGGLM